MARKPLNRFDVQVSFPGVTFEITSHKNPELTPLDVAAALEEVCVRIREMTKPDSSPSVGGIAGA